jgi:hypothetical protein
MTEAPQVVLGPPITPPPLPGRPLRVTQEGWEQFWASPQAAHVLPAHLPALMRLFSLRDQRERFAREGLRDSVGTGSTGQLVLSPLVKHLPVLDAAILALEDRFGLSPKHSIALSEGFDDASAAAARANAALADGFEAPSEAEDEPKPVRRLAAVE